MKIQEKGEAMNARARLVIAIDNLRHTPMLDYKRRAESWRNVREAIEAVEAEAAAAMRERAAAMAHATNIHPMDIVDDNRLVTRLEWFRADIVHLIRQLPLPGTPPCSSASPPHTSSPESSSANEPPRSSAT